MVHGNANFIWRYVSEQVWEPLRYTIHVSQLDLNIYKRYKSTNSIFITVSRVPNVRGRSYGLRVVSCILQSVLRQVHSLFQSPFAMECDLVLPLSILSNLYFPNSYPIPAYVFFLVFPLFVLASIFPSITCFRRHFLRKMWPSQLPYLLHIVYKIFLSSMTPCNTSFPTWSV
jgi:hypothetical protein